MNKKADAVIVAAGCGKRSGLSVPKQFFEVSGRPVLSYTVDAFRKHSRINNIIVVLPYDGFDEFKDYSERFTENVIFVRGGETRMQSVYNGLEALKNLDHEEIVCIHDGVRPFVTEDVISDGIDIAEKYGAALAAIQITDTVKSVENGTVESTLDREKLYLAQTPQTFAFDVIHSSYEKAIKGSTVFTDESAVAEHCGHKVHISKGSKANVKLTVPEDFEGLK